jgi:hypothetical protein
VVALVVAGAVVGAVTTVVPGGAGIAACVVGPGAVGVVVPAAGWPLTAEPAEVAADGVVGAGGADDAGAGAGSVTA